MQQYSIWLYPGEKGHIAVDILIPLETQDTVNKITLSVDGAEILEKTVYIYVQNAFSRVNKNMINYA